MCGSSPARNICADSQHASAFQLQDGPKFDTDVSKCDLNTEIPWRNR